MDANTVTGLVKQLQEANSPVKPDAEDAQKEQQSKNETILRILKELKEGVVATEDLLRASKAGVAISKLKSHSDASIVALSKEIVKSWKDTIDIAKKAKAQKAKEAGAGGGAGEVKVEGENKRKREEGEGAVGSGSTSTDGKDAKKVKAEGSSGDVKDEKVVKNEGEIKEESPARPPLSTIDSSRKVPRTAKADGVTGSLKPSPDDGDEQRAKCVVLLYDALAGDSTAEKGLLKERAQGIERAVWERFDQSSGNDYRQKMRSLYLNLKDKQNPALRNEIVLNYISVEKVANMSKDEMASESVRAMNEKIASENLFKAKAVGETQAETDAFKCGRCQQRKCTYYQMQTRSADEPMTTFVTCTNCGNRWKFS